MLIKGTGNIEITVIQKNTSCLCMNWVYWKDPYHLDTLRSLGYKR